METFLRVPREILEAIIYHLPLTNKVHFAATCHQLKNLIYGSSVLWHEIDFANDFNAVKNKKDEISNDIVERVLNSLDKSIRSAVYQIDLSGSGIHSQINEEVIGLVFSLCPNIRILALKDCPTIHVKCVADYLATLPSDDIVLPHFNKLLLQNDVHTASSIVGADSESLIMIHYVIGQLTNTSPPARSLAPSVTPNLRGNFASSASVSATGVTHSIAPRALLVVACQLCVGARSRTYPQCAIAPSVGQNKVVGAVGVYHLRRCTNCGSALCHARADSQDNRDSESKYCQPDGYMITCEKTGCRGSLCLDCAAPEGTTNASAREAHGWLFCGSCKTGVCHTCQNDMVEENEQWNHECMPTLEDMLAMGMLDFNEPDD
ncbi:hypothetical protein BC937DRAFT_90064 [Endogone sp. FLAS-F59071]|nr:hypothetical protein BC937DRAFT_90064 [Endogone sp. FLAS-F59071]|eukprot:RUS17372.1 hypothetical protein BC937DRAFT_90064 [Endogone sp. FLAS-F59071]